MNQKINQFISAVNFSINLLNLNDKSRSSLMVSLLAQEYLNAQIIYSKVNNTILYSNLIDGLQENFLSFDKFSNFSTLNINTSTKSLILELVLDQTYNLFKQKIKEFYKKFNEIESLISDCRECSLGKIKGNNIYFGTNKNILMIGEAPARNGWRITGKAWINENDKIIPSGKILEKLLENTNISLFDISFVEIIKCFPEDRKKLKEYSQNCLHFLDKQLELINPKIIIPLGEIPTKILLGDQKFKKLSDVVGKQFIYKSNYIVIPIFHPSPISPKSYYGNKPIFDEIINQYI